MNHNKTKMIGLKDMTATADRFVVQRLRGQFHRTVVLSIVVGVCSAIGLAPQIVRSDVVVVDVVAVAKGMRTGDLKGKAVVNEKNEKIGTVDDLIVGRDRVLFAVLQVGGFLGIGSHFVAVPYQSLQINDTGSKIVLPGASKEALQNLPEFTYKG